MSDPEHGRVSCLHPNGNFSYGSQCEFFCDEGYRMVGSATSGCEASALWSHPKPTCELIQCPELRDPSHGAVQCEDPLGRFSYRSSCEVRCEEGYTLTRSESNPLSCTSAGRWNDTLSSCEAVRCSVLEKPDNSRMSCTDDKLRYGSTCNFSCDYGFHLQGPSEITCSKDALWSQETPTCTEIQCPALESPQDGRVICANPNLRVDSVCSFTCNEGFTLDGSLSATCTGSGEWNTGAPICRAIQCAALESPQDGSMLCTDSNLGMDSICSFTCNKGFTLDGSSSVKCTGSGEWNAGAPNCRAIQCPAFESPQDGSVFCSDANLGVESLCSFTCNEGFILDGTPSMKCTGSGEWNTGAPICTAVTCPSLQKPLNGLLNCSSSKPVFNTSCYFSCNSGFQLHGQELLKCSGHGNWTAELPECRELPNSSMGGVLTTAAGGTAALSALSVMIGILKRLRQRKAKKFDLSDSDIEMPNQVYKGSVDSLI